MARTAYSPAQEDAIREEIARAAKRLFVDQGFAGVTMRAVAAEVGCSPMRLYRYFPNKRGLLRRIWEDIFEKVFARVGERVEAAKGPVEGLRAFAEGYVGYWFENPEEYRVIFLNEDAVAEEGEEFYVYSSDVLERFGAVGSLFGQAMAEGRFRATDPDACAEQFLCALQGVAHMIITVPEYPWTDRERVLTGLVDTLLRGYAR